MSNKTGGGSSGDAGVNVKVVCRVRPPSENEKNDANHFNVIQTLVDRKQVVVTQSVPGRKIADSFSKTFTFDGVCNTRISQEEVFGQHIAPIVDEVLHGFNCTIFAYGQTGTGKTFTMEGDMKNFTRNEKKLTENAGVIPRAVCRIFDSLESSDFSVRVSYLEIYNEELCDLLAEEKQNLRIMNCEDPKKGLSVDKLEEVPVASPADVLQIVEGAINRRRTAETQLNKCSSRSHCIFTLTILLKEPAADGEDVLKVGKLNLVDLAGSENVSRSGALAVKARSKEAGMINQSLLTLGRVINALVEHAGHVPYRDSKLTRLLKMAIKAMSGEVERLKQELQWMREKEGMVNVPHETWLQMQNTQETQKNELAELESELKVKQNDLKDLQRLFGETEETLQEVRSAHEKTQAQLEQTSEQLETTKGALKDTRVALEEESFVVAEKEKSEARLVEKGEALRQRLKHAMQDMRGLHEKISRQSDTAQRNSSREEQMKTELQSRLHESALEASRVSLCVGESLEAVAGAVEEDGKRDCELKASMEKCLVEAKKNSEARQVAALQEESESCGRQRALIAGLRRGCVEGTSAVCSAVKEAERLVEEECKRGRAQIQKFDSQLGDMLKSAAEFATSQREQGEELNLRQLGEARSFGVSASEVLQKEKERLEDLKREIRTMEERRVSKAHSLFRSLKETAEEQQKQMHSKLDRLLGAVTEAVTEMKQQVENESEESRRVFSEAMETFSVEAAGESRELTDRVKAREEKLSAFENDLSMAASQWAQSVETGTNVLMETVSGMGARLNDIDRTFVEVVDSNYGQLCRTETCTQEGANKVADRARQIEKTHMAALQAVEEGIKKGEEKSGETVRKLIAAGTKELGEQNKTVSVYLAKRKEESIPGLRKQLEECGEVLSKGLEEHADRLRETEERLNWFCDRSEKVMPTGQTPAKWDGIATPSPAKGSGSPDFHRRRCRDAVARRLRFDASGSPLPLSSIEEGTEGGDGGQAQALQGGRGRPRTPRGADTTTGGSGTGTGGAAARLASRSPCPCPVKGEKRSNSSDKGGPLLASDGDGEGKGGGRCASRDGLTEAATFHAGQTVQQPAEETDATPPSWRPLPLPAQMRGGKKKAAPAPRTSAEKDSKDTKTTKGRNPPPPLPGGRVRPKDAAPAGAVRRFVTENAATRGGPAAARMKIKGTTSEKEKEKETTEAPDENTNVGAANPTPTAAAGGGGKHKMIVRSQTGTAAPSSSVSPLTIAPTPKPTMLKTPSPSPQILRNKLEKDQLDKKVRDASDSSECQTTQSPPPTEKTAGDDEEEERATGRTGEEDEKPASPFPAAVLSDATNVQ
uniref:Kinesin motor domain-containing protein n=1 Tax=Chromera velia CCMP2878 TaxID=1169474 RepID=A0A0G4FCM0_9ALVE|eukprot:Cvel_3211.t1-p1 / transcript=Cvel_3211.t1 / gene=Cvel_3211 / organism=Chromera_velia_CCMP2878 / gene_product=Probable 125 kDa kinesin-related protein, putative / transcript_product=Probable 125 kDa kinesin-related protein, putative / location=Cvel_scaffold125:78620-90946(+) / protein_length=1335 / sequence_SO=supercontig / SO=protein_coding / is_pseudo=false